MCLILHHLALCVVVNTYPNQVLLSEILALKLVVAFYTHLTEINHARGPKAVKSQSLSDAEGIQ